MAAPIIYGQDFFRPYAYPATAPPQQKFKSFLQGGRGLRRPGIVQEYDHESGKGIVGTSTLCSRRGERSTTNFRFSVQDAATEALRADADRRVAAAFPRRNNLQHGKGAMKAGIRVYFEVENDVAVRLTRGDDEYDRQYAELIDFVLHPHHVSRDFVRCSPRVRFLLHRGCDLIGDLTHVSHGEGEYRVIRVRKSTRALEMGRAAPLALATIDEEGPEAASSEEQATIEEAELEVSSGEKAQQEDPSQVEQKEVRFVKLASESSRTELQLVSDVHDHIAADPEFFTPWSHSSATSLGSTLGISVLESLTIGSTIKNGPRLSRGHSANSVASAASSNSSIGFNISDACQKIGARKRAPSSSALQFAQRPIGKRRLEKLYKNIRDLCQGTETHSSNSIYENALLDKHFNFQYLHPPLYQNGWKQKLEQCESGVGAAVLRRFEDWEWGRFDPGFTGLLRLLRNAEHLGEEEWWENPYELLWFLHNEVGDGVRGSVVDGTPPPCGNPKAFRYLLLVYVLSLFPDLERDVNEARRRARAMRRGNGGIIRK